MKDDSVHGWASSMLKGETSLEAGVLGLLATVEKDFEQRRLETRYQSWVQFFSKRSSLDEDLLGILSFSSTSENLLKRCIALVSDFVHQGAFIHKSAFSVFQRNFHHPLHVLLGIYIPAGLAFVAADLNRGRVTPALFVATAEALLAANDATVADKLHTYLVGLWAHFKTEIAELQRELLICLLPLSRLASVRKIIESCKLTGVSRVPVQALQRMQESGTPQQTAILARRILRGDLPDPSVLVTLENHARTSPVALCCFRFACFVDLFLGDATTQSVQQIVQWLRLSKVPLHETLKFAVAQMKGKPAWRDNFTSQMKNSGDQTVLETLTRTLIGSERAVVEFELLNSCLKLPLIISAPATVSAPKPDTALSKRSATEANLPTENKLADFIKKLRQI